MRAGQRVVVAFPHRGEALRTQNLLRRVEARAARAGRRAAGTTPALLFAVSPARRGFVWRDLGLVAAARPPGLPHAARRAQRRLGGRALQSFADLRTGDYVVHEDHGVGKLLGFETKEVAGVTRDYLLLAFRGDDRLYVPHEQIGKVSRYIGADAKAPALSKLGGKAWQTAQDARARVGAASSPASCSRSTRSARRARASRTTSSSEWLERLEASSRTARRRTRRARSRR